MVKQQRNSQIERLRIVSILMIIAHHYVLYGVMQSYDASNANQMHKSARLCHLHGENLPQYRRLSATSSAPLPPKSSAGNPTDRARRY